jgi:hypothetical protein
MTARSTILRTVCSTASTLLPATATRRVAQCARTSRQVAGHKAFRSCSQGIRPFSTARLCQDDAAFKQRELMKSLKELQARSTNTPADGRSESFPFAPRSAIQSGNSPNRYTDHAARRNPSGITARQALDSMTSTHHSTAIKAPDGHLLPTPLRFRPSVEAGRSVTLGRSNLTTRLAHLDSLIKNEKVKSMSISQKFHERPGLRRKRLKSARWRKGFKKDFYGLISKIREMRSMGW